MKLKIVYTFLTYLLLSSALNANCALVVGAVTNPSFAEVEYNNNCLTTIDSSAPFITIWNTEFSGNKKSITIPGIGENYSIYWEEIDNPENRDSTIGNNTTLITLPNPGKYSVSITPGEGTFHRIHFNNVGDKNKIYNIVQWGDIEWSSFASAFKGCGFLYITAIDQPILSNVTDMSEMFYRCFDIGASTDIGHWDVSNVTNMNSMFYRIDFFNLDIGNWNVANVTDMSGMLYQARSFNQNIGSWNIQNVNDMRWMLNESGLNCDNYSSTLIGWSNNPLTPKEITLHAEGLKFSLDAYEARDSLIFSKGWTIIGDDYGPWECRMSVSTETIHLDSSLKLFPNPFDTQLLVEYSGVEQVTIILYDQLSRKVVQQSFYNSTTIDTEHLPQGLYIYELKKNHQIIKSGKIVKQ